MKRNNKGPATIVKNGKRVPAREQGKPRKKKEGKRKPIIPPDGREKHAQARLDKSELTWERLFSLGDNWKAHEAKAKEHAKTEKEAADEYKLPDLTKHQYEVLARREKEAKIAKNDCHRTCKRIVVEMLSLIDGAKKGEFLPFRGRKKDGDDLATVAPPETKAPPPEEGTGKLEYPKKIKQEETQSPFFQRPIGELVQHGLGETHLRTLREGGVRAIHDTLEFKTEDAALVDAVADAIAKGHEAYKAAEKATA